MFLGTSTTLKTNKVNVTVKCEVISYGFFPML